MKLSYILFFIALLVGVTNAWQNATQVSETQVLLQVQPFGENVTTVGPIVNVTQIVEFYLMAGRSLQLNISNVTGNVSFVVQHSSSNPVVSTSEKCVCANSQAQAETQLQQFQGNLPGALNFFTLYILPNTTMTSAQSQVQLQAQEKALVKTFSSVSIAYKFLSSDLQVPQQATDSQRQAASATPVQFVFWNSTSGLWMQTSIVAFTNVTANFAFQQLSNQSLQVGANTFAVINTVRNMVGFRACNALCTSIPSQQQQEQQQQQQQQQQQHQQQQQQTACSSTPSEQAPHPPQPHGPHRRLFLRRRRR